ncbi:MAG: hypothetical protein JWQ89_927 [Devosia sp.]|uniref:hypothetical protein n=1 Tax=Devosia sp. TaxID=1871048 RepID=UPI002638B7FA|nr:hypothetical protein [Devosia sp.]MDB5539200.1 hypothetical protein [Devosia sp.]
MAELIRPFVSPLGAWNAQVPQLKAMLASSHVSPSQKAQAAADAEKLLAEVRSAQSAFLMATSEVAGHDRVHDVRLSMSHIEQQLSQVLASLSS